MERLDQLDSMRGLAAATVLIGHCLGVYSVFWVDTYGQAQYGLVNLLKFTPLSIVIAGHEAVVFFFVLSGFVLMLPFLSAKPFSYGTFVARRFLRIYLPYYGAILLALLIRSLLAQPDTNVYSEWIGLQWQSSLTWELLVQHLFLIGDFDSNSLNPVIWSLVHEMRISLVFPLLALIALRWNWKAAVALVPALSLLGYVFVYLSFHSPPRIESVFQALDSMQYVSFFLAGALLAKYRTNAVRWWKRKSLLFKAALVGLGWVAYTYAYTVLPGQSAIHKSFMNEFATMLGALIAILAAIGSARSRKLLLWQPIRRLGQMSYSLYLYHFIILMALLWIVPHSIPLPLVLAAIVVLSLAAAYASYRWVELPSIRWGKSLFAKTGKPGGMASLEKTG
ncbi:acyltransferase family protein [Cohnella faecalis]|uniref:Acyltransferase n=1 Tax=Cohnella faecalis TaxID=2315694 RepID=A0A398CX73_9BACL|nr:acyltransferase [Cohnella faecalis]RIE03811.1 acyltransferase [Cohnella faecalis]